jgi:molecular chaperone DnaJ
MAKRDYYEVLGVSKTASKSEIKSAYRKLAKKFHPDVYDGDTKEAEDKFKEISEAYEVLADDEKRANYDRYGHAGVEGTFGRGGFDWSDFSHYGDISDIFGDFFGDSIFDILFGRGRRGRGRRPARGNDIRYNMELDLEEVFEGVTTEIEVPRTVQCKNCGGTGAEPGTEMVSCPQCGGAGQIRHVSTHGFSQFVRIETCGVCRGIGKRIEVPCKKCRGQGAVKKTSKIKIAIPEGAETGTHLRITGEGEAGPPGTPPGDLYVVIHVRQHPVFEREGPDIFLRRTLPFPLLALGGEIEVPTIDGKAKLKIPSGTQPGTVFKMSKKGMPYLGSKTRGDQFVKVDVEVPKKLTSKQKQLLKDLMVTEGGPKSKKTGFFGRD